MPALQGGEQDRVAASITRAVRDALVSILRCRASQAQPWQRKVSIKQADSYPGNGCPACIGKRQWHAPNRGCHLGQVVAALHALGAGEAADMEVRKGEQQVTSASGLPCLMVKLSWLTPSSQHDRSTKRRTAQHIMSRSRAAVTSSPCNASVLGLPMYSKL